MNFIKGMALMAFAASMSLATFAGNEGGGGGGICQNDKCITLTQAGFRIVDTTETLYSIPSATVRELDQIVEITRALDLELSTDLIIGAPSDITFVEVVDPTLYKKFIAEYREILSPNQPEMAKKVELLGFTSEKKTYLIKNKFDALDVRGQALLLIHEALLRNYATNLTEVMKFEGALADLLNDINNNVRPDYISFLHTADMKRVGSDEENPEFLSAETLRRSNLLAEFLLKYDEVLSTNSDTVTYSELLRSNDSMPFISNIVTPGYLHADEYFSRHKVVEKFYDYIQSLIPNKRRGSVQVTNQTLNDFLGKLSGPEVKTLKECGDVKDESRLAFGIEGNPAKLGKITCRVYHSPLISNLRGLDLNLPKPITCKWKSFREVGMMMVCEQ